MNDITHSDCCPESNTGPLEDCDSCMANLEQQQAYYGALYASGHRYTADEIRDAYSSPSDEHKGERLLRDLGL